MTDSVQWLMSQYDREWHAFPVDQVSDTTRKFLTARCDHSAPVELVDHTPPKHCCLLCLVDQASRYRMRRGGRQAVSAQRKGVIVVVSAYWLAIVGLIGLPSGIAFGLLWKSRRTRGEHSHYHPAVSVSAVATRIIRESAQRKSVEQRQQ